jgi:hypothetical protein
MFGFVNIKITLRLLEKDLNRRDGSQRVES